MKHLLTTSFLLLLTTALPAQQIVNAGFEDWPNTCPTNTAPNGWRNYTNTLIHGPDKAAVCSGSTVVSYDGNAHMNLVWFTTYSLLEGAEQTIKGLSPGKSYEINFYAINDQFLYSYGDPAIAEVLADSVVIFSTPELVSGGSWNAYTAVFNAKSDSTVIAFRVKQGSTGTAGCVGIDAVTIHKTINTGTPAIQGNHVSVYPNPFTDRIYITNSGNESIEFILFDPLYRICYREMLNGNIAVKPTSLSNGIYFYQLIRGDEIIKTGKLVK